MNHSTSSYIPKNKFWVEQGHVTEENLKTFGRKFSTITFSLGSRGEFLKQHAKMPISATDVPGLLVRLTGIKSSQFSVSVGDEDFCPQPRYYLTPGLKLHSED